VSTSRTPSTLTTLLVANRTIDCMSDRMKQVHDLAREIEE
jgi:hypothetical protein